MALSDEEQRLLDQLEASLAAEDPKFAQKLGGPAPKVVHKRRATLAGLGFVGGLALLLGGMQTHWVFSVLGFIVMLACAVIALTSWQRVDPARTLTQPAPDGEPFLGKMEDRWRRRQQGGS